MCEKLAKALDHLTNSEDRELFDFGKRAGEASPLVRMPSVECGTCGQLRLGVVFGIKQGSTPAFRAVLALYFGSSASCVLKHRRQRAWAALMTLLSTNRSICGTARCGAETHTYTQTICTERRRYDVPATLIGQTLPC